MAECVKCSGFAERLNLATPKEYRDLAHQLIEIVNQGTFLLIQATCPLLELFGETWPGDHVEHVFECVTCGRKFELHADTYHGWVTWTPR